MKNIFFNKKIEVFLLINTILVSIFLQIFLVPNLPRKYFYDSDNILEIILNKPSIDYDGSYMFAGKFFKIINIFNFSSFVEWAVLITIIMSIITMIFLTKFSKISLDEMILIYCIVGFLNIYVYRISKDFIQMIFFIVIYFIAIRTKSYKKSVLLILSVFIIEANVFRSYYFITAILFVFFIYLFNNKSLNNKKIFIYIVSGLIFSLYILQIFKPEIYDKIINIRIELNENRLGSSDAITQINDVFYNSNAFFYLLNYFINLFRVLFPLELVFKGVKYIPFIIFQVYLSKKILKKLKYIKYSNKNMKILMSIIVSYILVANLYEPDFGSFIRHEVSLYFIIISIILFEKRKWRFSNETCLLNNVS